MNDKSVVMALGMVAGILLFGSNAGANQAVTTATERASVAVSLAGIDLSTKAGAAAAAERINSAAKKLCRRFSDDRKISDWETFVDCYRTTTAEVFRQLEAGNRQIRSTAGT